MIALSLSDIFGQKEGTTILERVAFVLRLSIYAAMIPNNKPYDIAITSDKKL